MLYNVPYRKIYLFFLLNLSVIPRLEGQINEWKI